MKKLILGSMVAGAALLSACGSSNGSGEETATLDLYMTMGLEGEKQAFREVIEDFEEENPGIQVEPNFPGDGYEDMMRVRMGADDMPDLFDTHGWSKTRYKEYAKDLQEMNWVDRIDPAFESIMKTEEGNVYALPINQAKDGITYSENVLNEYGIEPPTTYDEFIEALRTIKEESGGEVTPFWLGGGDESVFGQYIDQMATPLLVTDEENNYEEELMNGTFDWSNFEFLLDSLETMEEEGLFNEDVLTANNAQATQLFAQGKIGFSMAGGSVGPEVSEIAPDQEIGIIPTPAVHEGDDPSWIGGERHTLAIADNSEHAEEAKKFLEFMAQDENIKKVAEATSLPAGLEGVETETYFSEHYENFSDIKVEPYFDRIYLPSGMWGPLGKAGQEVVADSLTPEEAAENLGDEYHRLRESN